MSAEGHEGFLSRWSRRKAQVQRGEPPAEPPAAAVAPVPVATVAPPVPDTPAAAPPPTLEEARALDPRADDFSRFVGRDVDPQVRHTALKTLFSDPHFNVIDGLDVYIDDYGKPDPLPPGMLRNLAQSTALGLFPERREPVPETAPEDPPALAEAPASEAAPDNAPRAEPHEDPDLRLQPDDAAGPSGDRPGPGEDAGHAH
jgi:hypothetical protein